MADVDSARNRLLTSIVKLTYAAALRSSAGFDVTRLSQLSEARNCLSEAKQVFEEYGHRRYQLRALLELAIAAIYARDHLAGVQYVREMERVSAQLDEDRWTCEVLLCKSRVARELWGDSAEAERVATLALKRAQEAGLRVCEIEARLQRGHARLERNQLIEGAQSDLKEASRLSSSPRHRGVADLLLARSFLRLGQRDLARRKLEVAEAAVGTLEFPVLQDLLRTVRAEYDASVDKIVVVIDPDKEGLDYDYCEGKFRAELIRCAMAKSNQVIAKAARSLNVTRTTLHSWMKQQRTIERQNEAAGQ